MITNSSLVVGIMNLRKKLVNLISNKLVNKVDPFGEASDEILVSIKDILQNGINDIFMEKTNKKVMYEFGVIIKNSLKGKDKVKLKDTSEFKKLDEKISAISELLELMVK